MAIPLMSVEDTQKFLAKYVPASGRKSTKYDWYSMEVDQGFTIKHSEMPSVNYSGPTLPDSLFKQGYRISCRKVPGHPEIAMVVHRVK